MYCQHCVSSSPVKPDAESMPTQQTGIRSRFVQRTGRFRTDATQGCVKSDALLLARLKTRSEMDLSYFFERRC